MKTNEAINLIFVAMQEELDSILPFLHVEDIKKSNLGKMYSFSIGKEKFLMMTGKIGKVATGFFLGRISERYKIKRIFNIGTSGALNASLKIGDVVLAKDVIYYDVDVEDFGYDKGQVPSCPASFTMDEEYLSLHPLKEKYSFQIKRGRVISGDTFLTRRNIDKVDKDILKSALCCDMESGAVSQCTFLMHIPVIILRTISDHIFKEDGGENMNKNLKMACENGAKVLFDLIS